MDYLQILLFVLVILLFAIVAYYFFEIMEIKTNLYAFRNEIKEFTTCQTVIDNENIADNKEVKQLENKNLDELKAQSPISNNDGQTEQPIHDQVYSMIDTNPTAVLNYVREPSQHIIQPAIEMKDNELMLMDENRKSIISSIEELKQAIANKTDLEQQNTNAIVTGYYQTCSTVQVPSPNIEEINQNQNQIREQEKQCIKKEEPIKESVKVEELKEYKKDDKPDDNDEELKDYKKKEKVDIDSETIGEYKKENNVNASNEVSIEELLKNKNKYRINKIAEIAKKLDIPLVYTDDDGKEKKYKKEELIDKIKLTKK